jgi:hypothetical protein
VTNPRFQSRFGDSALLSPMGVPQPEPPRKPTTFEVLSMLIVPALSLVATIVALERDQRVLYWGFSCSLSPSVSILS